VSSHSNPTTPLQQVDLTLRGGLVTLVWMPARRIKKKKRQNELAVLWLLSLVFLGAIFIWLLDGTITSSVATTTSLITQKINHTLRPVVNDLETAAYDESIQNSNGEFMAGAANPIFDNASMSLPPTTVATRESESQVLAANRTADGREKWIEVDLSDQRVYAKEGEATVYNFRVSTGKKWTPTPVGEYRVWIKLRYHTMIGGSKARGDYYNLPNVPYVMYFHKGYGIHGAYWHNQFGTPRSHGCVNVKPEEMALIYNWAGPEMPAGASVVKSTTENPGIRIVIHQ
jgi:lipoprotein-anchoring transpeptidase ErfK/SrfK